jgi:hypothetical protein
MGRGVGEKCVGVWVDAAGDVMRLEDCPTAAPIKQIYSKNLPLFANVSNDHDALLNLDLGETTGTM